MERSETRGNYDRNIPDSATRHPGLLIDFCRGKVGKWEVPKYVQIVPELPKGGTHKIAKHQLREGFRQHPDTLPWGERLG